MTHDMWSYHPEAHHRPGMRLTSYTVVATDGPIGTVEESTEELRSTYVVVDTGPWRPVDLRQARAATGRHRRPRRPRRGKADRQPDPGRDQGRARIRRDPQRSPQSTSPYNAAPPPGTGRCGT